MPPLILAHRTGVGRAPENSMQGFLQCARDGADALECDITFTKDGEPFVWDIASARLQDINKPLSEMNFREARKMARLDCGEGIMHLNDIWDFIETHPRVKVYFDMKYYESHIQGNFVDISRNFVNMAIEKIVQPAMKQNMARRVGFVTFLGGLELLKAAKSESHKISTSLMVVIPWFPMPHDFSGVDSITMGWSKINLWKCFRGRFKEIMAEAKKNEMLRFGGLANTSKEIEWVIRNDFDGIWSDDILCVREIIDEHNKK